MTEWQYFDSSSGYAWDAALLEPMAELNAEILETVASGPARSSSDTEFGLQWRWRALGAPARVRLTRCPFLLIDAGFAQPQRWLDLPAVGVHDAGPLRAACLGAEPLGTPLLRRLLLFAWHLARANRLGARVALGMHPSCANVLAGCRFADLEALAEQRPPWIRPRWEDRPDIWKAWMAAAAEESPRGLERLRLWGLQSLAVAVVAHHI